MLGVSAGACIGASLGILFGLNSFAIQGCAFIGGLAAVLLTTTVPKVMTNEALSELYESEINIVEVKEFNRKICIASDW